MGVILTILLPFFYSVVRIAWKEQERDRCPIINAALVTFMWTIVFFSLFILCVDSQFSSHFYIFRCSFFIPSSQFGELVMMIDLLWNAFKSSHIPKLERERNKTQFNSFAFYIPRNYLHYSSSLLWKCLCWFFCYDIELIFTFVWPTERELQ